jgi:hypothetical protein
MMYTILSGAKGGWGWDGMVRGGVGWGGCVWGAVGVFIYVGFMSPFWQLQRISVNPRPPAPQASEAIPNYVTRTTVRHSKKAQAAQA